jgi:phosphoserine phosphatase
MTAPQQNIAAFFDLDGTLLPPPSLEWRFIGYLLGRDQIATAHVAGWLAQFAKTIVRDPHNAIAGNKSYLAGIETSLVDDWEHSLAPPSWQDESLALFDQGLERIAWHHAQGHKIFLITGTLAPLAQLIARRISQQVQAPIEVQATELEVSELNSHSHTADGDCARPSGQARLRCSGLCSYTHWTGRRASQHMSYEAKSRAIKALAVTYHLALTDSYAYGNSAADLLLLGSVGHAVAVNPRRRLSQIAQEQGWPVYHWREPAAAAARPRVAQFAAKAWR